MTVNNFNEGAAQANPDSLTEKAKALSQSAYEEGKRFAEGASEVASTVSTKMKDMGVNGDAMVDAAKDGVSGLRALLVAEVRQRPLASIAFAAFIGLWFGSRF